MTINASIHAKLHGLTERYQELAALLSSPEIITDQERFRRYAREYAEIEDIVECYHQYQAACRDRDEAEELASEEDPELRLLAKTEMQVSLDRINVLETRLQRLLLPKDPDDQRNIFLEIRAGAGGSEAALFVGDLYRMYRRYAEARGWQVEVISTSDGEQGGYKEIIVRILGQNVYANLKYESGGHRVQRVPETESQGRIHTSVCTVAVMPEADEQAAIDIRKEDLRIDTFRSSGAGGQHVNTTDSAIRITHLISGIVVECQDERSQHKNKAKAMALLATKLADAQRRERAQQTSSLRKSLVGSGDRSERIRTYNFPQGRVTDHRIALTLYRLNSTLVDGELDDFIEPLKREEQATQLAALASNA